ncbi:unnamed protein product [Didymodactylos carnosus]|uniref:Uncharacterized protein n=1 Tax=Didymodactylos carnosus TaxID=1234261 RepID=A0A815VV62_9BILA|nr:unnamed protein product [Didymodactylos carnosus]CAF1536975.1 unnamed protein product [Didymodactylos carnosus]CAF4207612.1 unnamed protein product [Didymodactylos carnosus]CAF4396908.1 unnamed protein product [Didymodactylos carnosus]
MLEALQSLKIQHDDSKPLEQQLIHVVCIPSLKENNQNNTENFSKRRILTKDVNKKWTLKGFYHKADIHTADGSCYVGSRIDSELYGYRYGTKEEAEQLNFVLHVT